MSRRRRRQANRDRPAATRGSGGDSSGGSSDLQVEGTAGGGASARGGPWLPWAGGAALLVAFVWSYWPTFVEIVQNWAWQPDYSHGFLVIPIAAFFLWSRRAEFPADSLRPSALGIGLLLLAGALRITGATFYLSSLDGWTIPIWIAGSVWLLCGWPCLRWSLPAIAFLWFMVPIPFAAEQWLSVPLQAIATKLSTGCLVMLGFPAVAEGNTIWVGEQQLFVEEACSGLRIFVGIFALAFAFALLSRWNWWQKLAALAMALPIALVANMLRVVVTGVLFQMLPGATARHISHDLSGLFMIPLAAAMFWLFLWYLEKLIPEVEALSPVEAGTRAKSV